MKQLDGRESGAGLHEPKRHHGLAATAQRLTQAQEAKRARLSSKENKAVRRLAWLCLDLSHCWPEQFSESRILQPEQATWMRSLFAPARVRGFSRRPLCIHFFNLSMKGSAANAELLGRSSHVAIGRGERLHDQFFLCLVQI